MFPLWCQNCLHLTGIHIVKWSNSFEVLKSYWIYLLIFSSSPAVWSLACAFPLAGILQFSSLTWDLEFRWYLIKLADSFEAWITYGEGLWERVPGGWSSYQFSDCFCKGDLCLSYCILFLALFLSSYLCSGLITICGNNHKRKCNVNLRTGIYWQNINGNFSFSLRNITYS